MQAERTATLGDVHHPIDELRNLCDKGSEFIDHDHQAGRAVRVVASLQLQEVLRLLPIENVLSTAQLGGE